MTGNLHNEPSTSQTEDDLSSSSVNECDIGKLMESHTDFHKLTRDAQYRILPNADRSSYPRTHTGESGAYRQFQPTWLKSYPWLHYSGHCDGAFCRACVFFAPDQVGGQRPGLFVSKPFKSWKKIGEKALAHSKQDYHKLSLAKMNEFLDRYKNPSQSIGAILNTSTGAHVK